MIKAFKRRDIIRWLITIGLLYAVSTECGPWTTLAFVLVAIWMESVKCAVNLFTAAVDKATDSIEDVEAVVGSILEKLDIQEGREKWISSVMEGGRKDGH